MHDAKRKTAGGRAWIKRIGNAPHRERETESGERSERGLLKGHGTYPRRAKLGRGWGGLGEG